MVLSLLLPVLALAAVPADKVDSLPGFPGFNASKFDFYSGYFEVPGPFTLNDYDSLLIHYQVLTAMENSATAPVVAWHQGGPGGSSVQGSFIEMSYFLVGDELKVNPNAWNRVANMLMLESPAGSGDVSGYSQCMKGGKPVVCKWNDVTQGEAYAHTLRAFYKAYPEFKSNDFYLAGESYFGQYGPNIAHFITTSPDFKGEFPLKGMLVGNGCWGGDATHVNCNGPDEAQMDIDIYFGKALISKKMRDEVYSLCAPAWDLMDDACSGPMDAVHAQVGPYNVYDIYDNCPATTEYLRITGMSMRSFLGNVRQAHADPAGAVHAAMLEKSGGFDWNCGGTYPPGKIAAYMLQKDVQQALHLKTPGLSAFLYETSGPASVLLYPELAKKLDILIYNGDADMSVPYKGNEQWITMLEKAGALKEKEAWKPWYMNKDDPTPTGAVTTYSVPGAEFPDTRFTFLTIRLAGHMVPLFRPDAALTFFSRFIEKKPAMSIVV